MNVYDFDGTICYPDSSLHFAIFCMNRHPHLWFTFFPKTLWNLMQYKRRKITRTIFIRRFFSILQRRDFDRLIEQYWDRYEKNISAWYLAQKKPDDLIISASPSCIIGPIARRLGVRFAATEYDREFGVFTDNLMFAKGKARYIIDHGFPVIDNFYSDSLSDTPIALCAEKAYMVVNKAREIIDWPKVNPDTIQKIRKQIDTGWTVHI